MKSIFYSIVLLTTLNTSLAFAHEIEVQLGTEVPSQTDTDTSLNLLFKLSGHVGFGGGCSWGESDALCPRTRSQYILARIEAEGSYNSEGDDLASRLPYHRIQFVPLMRPLGRQETMLLNDGIARFGADRTKHLRILPIQSQSDTRVGRRGDLTLSAVGIDARWQSFPMEHLGVLLEFAADALGFRRVWQEVPEAEGTDLSNTSFSAFHVVNARLAAGILIPLNQRVAIELRGGAETDYSVAPNVQILGIRPYGRIEIRFKRGITLFGDYSTTLRRIYQTDAAHDAFDSETQIRQFLGGMSFRYWGLE